jgi:SpoVK/Ycf46/Vps4 family AAA+-type ATPase
LDLVTDTILSDLGQTRLAVVAAPDPRAFDDVWGAPIRRAAGPVESVKKVIIERFAKPIALQSLAVRDGKSLEKGTRLSAIMYGPPGTSKTRYASAISKFIGWDLISIDPSHLLRRGFENIQVEMTNLFRMLEYAERVVVFFDEIDELVRERGGEGREAASRFLTTSMLPRLGRLRESRRLVFLVATNHLEVVDTAIQRPGRFDLVIPVMPPTTRAKLNASPEVASTLESFALSDSEKRVQRERLEALTYDEFAAISKSLADAQDRHEFIQRLEEAWKLATVNQAAGRGQTALRGRN